jgi:hypothetical protein
MSTSAEAHDATFVSLWRWTGLLYGAMTIVGVVGGGLLFGLVKDDPDMRYGQKHPEQVFVFFLQMGGCFGCLLGIAQWIALRQFVHQALRQLMCRQDLPLPAKRMVRETAWWIVATLAGMIGGASMNGLLFILLLEADSSLPNESVIVLFYFVMAFLIQGISLAWAQWILLRRRVQSDVGWIGWTGIALALIPFGVLLLIALRIGGGPTSTYVLVLVMGGCLLGIFQVRSLRSLAPEWVRTVRERFPQSTSDASASAGQGGPGDA